MTVELRNLTTDDHDLYVRIHTDHGMMEHLGGPLPADGLAEKLAKDAAATDADESWVLVIVPDDEPAVAAGTIAIWDHGSGSERVTEIGWMVLPEFQGRGLGSAAARAAISRARTAERWDALHAYPPVSNPRSNAMCKSLGFELIAEEDFEFRGRSLRCNHWRLPLGSPADAVGDEAR